MDSADNPADDGSRGIWSKRWLDGPDFLINADLCIQQVNSEVSPLNVEVKCLVNQSVKSHEVSKLHLFGNWFSTLKLWACILRFIDNCRGAKRKGDLKVEEYLMSMNTVIRMVQRSCFEKELGTLSKKIIARSSPLAMLDVFLDQNGLIRVGGRIRHSTLSDEMKHPVILPSDHEVSWLIIQHLHHKTHHQGRGITCSEVRSHGFWILSMERTVKKFIRTYVTCCRLRGRPVEQKMANLPDDTLSTCYPFWFMGCDLFGPFLVKSGR